MALNKLDAEIDRLCATDAVRMVCSALGCPMPERIFDDGKELMTVLECQYTHVVRALVDTLNPVRPTEVAVSLSEPHAAREVIVRHVPRLGWVPWVNWPRCFGWPTEDALFVWSEALSVFGVHRDVLSEVEKGVRERLARGSAFQGSARVLPEA